MISNRLQLYTVHVKEGDSEQLPLFVSEGFNFYAFIFTAFWALYHMVWVLLAIILGFNMLLTLLLEFEVVSPASGIFIGLVFQLWLGFEGNDWRRKRLKKDGYVMSSIVSGASEMEAEQRYFDRLVEEQAMSAAKA